MHVTSQRFSVESRVLILLFSTIVAILESQFFSYIDILNRFELESMIAISLFQITQFLAFTNELQTMFRSEASAFDENESAEVREGTESLSVGQQQEGISIGNFCG